MMLNFPETENVILLPSTIDTPLEKSVELSGTAVTSLCVSGTVLVS
jgi:hypothetical protein